MRIYYYCLVLLCLSACGKKSQTKQSLEQKPTKTFYKIDLSHDFTGSNDSLLLSDIVENVEYVKLETSDDCLIEGGSGSIYSITKDNIYAMNRFKTPFCFERKTGKYINTIGSIGQGPKDILCPIHIFGKDSLVYIQELYTKEVKIYAKNGRYIKSIRPARKGGSAMSFAIIDHQYIIQHPRQIVIPHNQKQKEAIWNNYFSVLVSDLKGNEIYTQKHVLEVNEMLVGDDEPIKWYYDNLLNFYNYIDDTIYAVTGDSIIPRYYLNMGKNKWPVSTAKMTKEYTKYIRLQSVRETKDFLYLYWAQNKKAYLACFNKHDETLKVQEQNPISGFFTMFTIHGLPNDIDGYDYSIDFKNLVDEESSILIEVNCDNIDEIKKELAIEKNIKFPEKRLELLRLLEEMKEEDNPILAIYKLKR